MAQSFDPASPSEELLAFLTERHLATLTTVNTDGDIQVTPVGVTYEPERSLARVITWATSRKALNVAEAPEQRVAVCQIDGGRWLTLYGTATVTSEAEAVEEAVERYAARYRQPKVRDDRVVIEIALQRIIGRA